MAIKINGVNHFAISVPNQQESVAWYEKVFDFKIFDYDEIPGTGIKVAHMLGKGFILEIFEPQGGNALPEDRKIPNLDLLTHGNKHISFGVPDRFAAKKELEDLGVDIAMVVDDAVFIHDNAGNLIEIFEERGEWWDRVTERWDEVKAQWE